MSPHVTMRFMLQEGTMQTGAMFSFMFSGSACHEFIVSNLVACSACMYFTKPWLQLIVKRSMLHCGWFNLAPNKLANGRNTYYHEFQTRVPYIKTCHQMLEWV